MIVLGAQHPGVPLRLPPRLPEQHVPGPLSSTCPLAVSIKGQYYTAREDIDVRLELKVTATT